MKQPKKMTLSTKKKFESFDVFRQLLKTSLSTTIACVLALGFTIGSLTIFLRRFMEELQ